MWRARCVVVRAGCELDIGALWARCGRDVGEIRAGCRRGAGEIWARDRRGVVEIRAGYGRDMGEVRARCGWDMGEIWAGCRRDVGVAPHGVTSSSIQAYRHTGIIIQAYELVLRRCISPCPTWWLSRSNTVLVPAGPQFELVGGRGGPSGPSAPSAPSRHLAISPSCRASRGRRPCFCSPGGPHAVASRASSRARASAGSSSSGTLLVAKCAAVWLIVAGLLARGAGVNARLSSLPFSTTASRVACTGGVGYPVCPAGGARTMLLEGDRRALLKLCSRAQCCERDFACKIVRGIVT